MCVCVCVCVCSYICLKFIYKNSSSAGVLQALAISPRSPVRPLLDAIRSNRCRQKPCPSVNSQNVAISLVIRYYRCRDLETCLMLNQKS